MELFPRSMEWSQHCIFFCKSASLLPLINNPLSRSVHPRGSLQLVLFLSVPINDCSQSCFCPFSQRTAVSPVYKTQISSQERLFSDYSAGLLNMVAYLRDNSFASYYNNEYKLTLQLTWHLHITFQGAGTKNGTSSWMELSRVFAF